jgi:NAD(P)-dependent dehydrogenase (short-subunit alcohol dehydrogenase family)
MRLRGYSQSNISAMFKEYLEQVYQLISYTLELFVTFAYHYFTWKVPNLDKYRSVVVITGCDTGFGHSLSLDLSQQGYHVIAASNSDSGVRSLKGKIARVILCDVTSEEQINQLRDEVEKYVSQDGLHLWAVVNNAGISRVGFTDWLDISLFERILDVNYMGAIRVTKAMLPLLKHTMFSRIVNVSSD